MVQDAMNTTIGSQQTLLSVLCTEDNWTPEDNTVNQAIAFRKDGVGCLKLLNDQPGLLLVCEFDWALYAHNERHTKADTVVDTQYKGLENSLRTRQVASFSLEIKLRKTKPREEFGNFDNLDVEESLARRLKEEAFEEEEYFDVILEAGNFAPDHDTNRPESAEFGLTRWGLRLSFYPKSPIPSIDKWQENYHGMVEAQSWQGQTKWFSHKLRGP